ncbi:Cdc7p-Dbf4p kinase complex regulatory subunit [Lithohypha guttulata]|nr:Cdc7p-Dbf4p kinase complex regulatory subunit [Lithohypha guttulata]
MATSTRRQPLMSIPNATNSPHRSLNLNNSGSKRSRALANVSQQENEPPTKRQAIEKSTREPVPITPRRHDQQDTTGGQVFERGHENTQNNFQKRLVAARDRTATSAKSTRSNVVSSKEVDSVRQWQKHYRKLFPAFRFFFDAVPDELKTRLIRQAAHFGAREETFFSKNVTHIISTRQAPDEDAVAKAFENGHGTINPSMLEIKNGRSTVRREVNTNDVLVRGVHMKMKIWPPDKLQKILSTLLEDTPGQESAPRVNKATRATNDLVQVLKNEKLAAAAERELAGIPRDLVTFRGPFLYVHDMDEKVKPIMVREYPKVARRQDGEWPQFRSASVGKCPFVEDPTMRREVDRVKALQKAQQLQQQQQREAQQAAARVKPLSTQQTLVEPKMNPPRRTSPRKVLRDVPNNVSVTQQQPTKPPPPQAPERQSSFPPMPEQPSMEFVKPSQLDLIREPSASGIQRSAMTSAIQSQMISSAAATGLKASTSREVNELKRKVLERTHTGSLSVGSISSQVGAFAGALKSARPPAPQRAAKSRAQEKLGGIQEEDPCVDDAAAERAARANAKRKKPTKREPKPGYCENCHDKYDDFEDHVISRKHRKFATTQSNWEELDALLAQLQGP